ncbi:hypothetical protein FOZ62_021084 [Perkinsus olseni]|uniref:Uncharacterized protein n=1 Tax=Perkinsus olseni TaxID=32597 RepID=A0A7J6PUJ6_PEROL|nr:hypothetical protein FOZ62_021084 [Perkinsus olseni]
MFTPPPPPPPLFNNPFHKLPTTPIHAQSSYSNAGGMLRIHMARTSAMSSDHTGYTGLGFHHSSSDVMELQLAVHALELENAALRRRAKERSKALVEAQGKVQSLQEALVEAELLNTGPRTSPSTSMLPPDYGVVSSDLRSIVGLLTKAGQLLQRPKECGALLVEVIAMLSVQSMPSLHRQRRV